LSIRILVIDNYDSFVFNIVQYLQQIGAECFVERNDVVSLDLIHSFDGVLISPGPGTPEGAGNSIDLVKICAQSHKPLLGVCLGHQAIGVAFGGIVSRAPEIYHGKTSSVIHNNSGVLSGIPNPFRATRYHSLAIEEKSLPKEIEVVARCERGAVMAIRHRKLPIHGVQFHPESILTENGHQIFGNWLMECGDDNAGEKSKTLSETWVNRNSNTIQNSYTGTRTFSEKYHL
jgi:para-aminobenzoate synthetase component II